MKRSCLFALIPGGIAMVALLFVVALLLVKLLWAWTIPDLFPGAVEQGLIAASITWFAALKIALFVAVVGGIAGIGPGRH